MNIRGGLKQTFLVTQGTQGTQGRELYESQKRQRTFAGLKTGLAINTRTYTDIRGP